MGVLSALLTAAAPETVAPATESPTEPERRSNSGAYVLVAPGVLFINPYNRYNKYGHQWGAQAGRAWWGRHHLGIGLGASFEHVSSVYTDAGHKHAAHFLRFQLETMPGLTFVDGRLFVHTTIAFGYLVGLGQTFSEEPKGATLDGHGPVLSPGVGLHFRVWRGLAIGSQVGADLHWATLTGDSEFYFGPTFDVEVSLGWFF